MQQSNFPIAIIGIGCRFPGGVNSPKTFWDLLKNGVDAMVDVPKNRWDMRKFYSENTNLPGKLHAQQAGFLQGDINKFDPTFFGISPREAGVIDPQQRLLLKVCYETIEDAGISMESLKGSSTGVFIGGFTLDNMVLHLMPHNRDIINSHTATGSTMVILSNRISYVFDLKGPSVTMDTACSSSLVAAHYACQSIWNGECTQAFTGGVNLMLRPEYPIAMSKGHFLSKHSRSKAFDIDGKGYARGEGAGMVLLKPLKQAKIDGDNIYAVIKASGINQDGQTTSISVPNEKAQENLIRTVYKKGAIHPKKIHYVEAHGTGTQAGDPRELKALNAILKKGRNIDEKVLVGSVKTNIGHLEAAAGIAGLIKTALVLQHNQVPPNLHFKQANPAIGMDQLNIKIPTQLEPLPHEVPSFASINSFGYGGTNAHIVLEQIAVSKESPKTNMEQKSFFFLPICAQSEEALRDLATIYAALLEKKQISFANLQYTLIHKRSHHQFRLTVSGNNLDDIILSLKTFSSDLLLCEGAAYYKDANPIQRKVVFVYTGMGPQWWAMGRTLFQSQIIFRRKLMECEHLFKEISGISILQHLNATEADSEIKQTQIAQPANLFIQIGLTALWNHWGIKADAVIGHSVGEVAAAYISGALSLKEALTVSYHRSRLQQTCAGTGKMLATGLNIHDAQNLLIDYQNVSIAAINSSKGLTLAGDANNLINIGQVLEKKGIFNKMLAVEVPYHSPQMELIKEDLLAHLTMLAPSSTNIPLYSTVTGNEIDGNEITANYWWKNVRQPVQFAKAMQQLLTDDYSIFLEVGPHPVLKNAIKDAIEQSNKKAFHFASLRMNVPENIHIHQHLGGLFCIGQSLDWHNMDINGSFIKLPNYPWQQQVYTHETSLSKEDRLGLKGHVFFNEQIRMPFPAYEVELNKYYFPFLEDHQINSMIVFPGAAYVEAGLALHQQFYSKKPCVLQKIEFKQLLIRDQNYVQKLHFQFNPTSNRYKVFSRQKNAQSPWQIHAEGRMIEQTLNKKISQIDIPRLQKKCPTLINIDALYAQLASKGLNYGPFFRSLKQVAVGNNCTYIQIEGRPSLQKNSDQYLLHPTILDAAFQAVITLFKTEEIDQAFVPVSIEQLEFFKSPENNCGAFLEIVKKSPLSIKTNMVLFDQHGNILVRLKELTCRLLPSQEKNEKASLLYQWFWEKVALSENKLLENENWIIFDNNRKSMEVLENKLSPNSPKPILVTKGKEFAKIEEDQYQINPETKEDFIQLFKTLEGKSYTNLLNCWTAIADANDPYEENLSHCIQLTNLVQAIATLEKNQTYQLTLLTKAAFQLAITGDAKLSIGVQAVLGLNGLINKEYPNINSRIFDITADSPTEEMHLLTDALTKKTMEPLVLFRNQTCYIRRLKKLNNSQKTITKTQLIHTNQQPISLEIGKTGQIGSLFYQPLTRTKPSEGEVEIEVHTAALNFKDLLKVMGQISAKVTENTYFKEAFGMECSGVITSLGAGVQNWKVGDEVIITAPGGCFRSYITTKPTYAILKPQQLSFEKGAILIPFLTTYYGLIDIANIQEGESILIHNATGGVGMAAIQIARWKKATIFTTAGTLEKRQMLQSMGIKYVSNSRDLTFVDDIMKWTDGKGIDVIINAISGESLFQSFNLLAPFGRFIEIGKKDISENISLPMSNFNKNLTFAAIDIDLMLEKKEKLAQRLLKDLATAFEKEQIHEIPTKIFNANDTDAAFRLLAQSKHIGKVMLQLKNQNLSIDFTPNNSKLISHQAAYLITGGTNGFGLELADFLSQKGAGQLILLSRKGAYLELSKNKIKTMRERGTSVLEVAMDIGEAPAFIRLKEQLKQSPFPLKGIIHGAMVLDDGYLQDMNEERYRKVFWPKVKGALNLANHLATPQLDFFISLSSISSIVSNPGQANYIAANAFLDGFSQYLRNKAIPAITLNLGALAESGVIKRIKVLEKIMLNAGIIPLKNQEVFDGLLQIIKNKATQIALFDLNWDKWLQDQQNKNNHLPFSELIKINNQAEVLSPQLEKLQQELAKYSKEKQLDFLEQKVLGILSTVLRLSVDKISREKGINLLGIDSLMTVELASLIKKETGIIVSNMELISSPNSRQISKILYNKIDFGQMKQINEIENMSEKELDALIAKLS